MFDLYEFKRHYALRGKDVVNCLNRVYPLFDKVSESKASHFDESGVCLTADAEAVLRAKFEAERYRRKSTAAPDMRIQIRTRVSDELHGRFRRQLERNRITAQSVITELVTDWVTAQEKAEKETAAGDEAPTAERENIFENKLS